MKIAHISDSHITPGREFKEEPFSQIVEEINKLPFDLVIHTGDVTDTGLREAYEYSRSFIDTIEKPLIVIPGNHDSRNVGYELFEEYYGEFNGVKEGSDYALIYVDSSIPDRNEGRVGSSKFNWLRTQLIKYSAKKIKIVAVHHHLVPVPKAGTERNVLFNAGDLMDLLQKYDVDLVLSGHRHYPNVVDVDGLVISNAGCMSCRKVRAGDVCSYNQVDISPQRVDVTIRRVGNKRLQSAEGAVHEKPFLPQRFQERQPHEYRRVSSEIFISEGRKLARIVHIAGTFFSDRKVFEKKKYENAVRKINALSPDLVVHCGDIVEAGIPLNFDLAEMYLSQIESPVVYTPGPRDINYIGYELFPRLAGGSNRGFETPLIRVHAVNSSQYDSDVGAVGRFELAKLVRAIREQEQEMSIVFLHHNVIPLPHIREKGLLEDAGDVLRALCDLQVDVVLTGHSSYPYASRVDNTVISNANAISCQYVRSLFGNSFNVVDIFDRVLIISELHSLWRSKRIMGIWWRKNSQNNNSVRTLPLV
ncbi:MAG: metallophosphoesterase [Theionarchaea archaeon]|nr:metallophosphoesterase [Theionarchaea archaeon]MBU6999739.1 metallophosphoesterase [Theionarchaea archaeon]MBU7020160.1 metallophosphoesterase [Theionarchaea archaeon]MBU7033723.1 metallophosphoesterase [Theionarchaea archaeon]MBU7039966.1 metallophosphoesterase [Theionarchaea archaeon]